MPIPPAGGPEAGVEAKQVKNMPRYLVNSLLAGADAGDGGAGRPSIMRSSYSSGGEDR
ncbi:MAG: hypothetical protein ACRDJ4_11335 [Actinomycetota bacterium]